MTQFLPPSTRPTPGRRRLLAAPWAQQATASRRLLASAPESIGPRPFAAGVAACTAAVAAFLLARLTAWPPHEDETLALFVGRDSLGGLLHTVLGQRGGAPLHFLFAWIVAHLGGGLVGLRLVSAAFAIASVPVIAALCSRLAGRAVALTATALASASWMLLFHGVYGRMYSLFLCTSALSYLALLVAVQRGGRQWWTVWAVSILLTVASHPYGALVLASQGVYVVLLRRPIRSCWPAFAAVAVLGIPFWRTDLVLAGRFDVGVGGGGEKLGSAGSLLSYLRAVAADFSVGYRAGLGIVLLLAAVGVWRLAKTRRREALLVAAVIGTPVAALIVARFGGNTIPESRHLIFALPFFSLLVATGLLHLARRWRYGAVLAAVGLASLLPAEVAWGWHETSLLFTGEPKARIAARDAASAWLAKTARPDDVLFGYNALFLQAWERSGSFSRLVVPRADSRLAFRALERAQDPLGRGVWVFDASDPNNKVRRPTIPLEYPDPASAFDARVWGPFLVIRTKEPTATPAGFLVLARQVEMLGKKLAIGDADINYTTVVLAQDRVARYERSPRSRSSVSR